MKKYLLTLTFFLTASQARADLWGGDLPLLAQIVTNTLQTLYHLEKQTQLMRDEMAGIKDRIYRVQTIAQVVQPSQWDEWRDPREAVRRLKIIYHTIPKEYRSEKSDAIESEISRAMNAISRIAPGAKTSFESGKELENRGKDSSPGVAQKLTASGVGSLVTLESQSLVLQSHITSLLTQILAEGNERESRLVVSRGGSFSGLSNNLGNKDGRFSSHVYPMGIGK